MIVGGGVLAVVILIAFATMGGGKDDAPVKPASAAEKAESQPPKEQPVKPARKKAGGGPKRVLKDPDTPAPELPGSVITAARAKFAQAQKQHEDARRAQAAGDGSKFNSLINDSWDTLQALDQELETYTVWLEEADMEAWKVPSHYSDLQRLIENYYGLRARIKRIKPNRR